MTDVEIAKIAFLGTGMAWIGARMAGSKRSVRRRKAGYWTRRVTITQRNIRRRIARHITRHPKDEVGLKAARRAGVK